MATIAPSLTAESGTGTQCATAESTATVTTDPWELYDAIKLETEIDLLLKRLREYEKQWAEATSLSDSFKASAKAL
jgi:hypothetical protein